MNKVCIVTLYGNFNLGNRLQNYAVQQKCLESNFKVKSIKTYTVDEKKQKYVIVLIINFIRRIKHFISSKKMFINREFLDFEKQHLLMDKYEVYSNENNKRLNKKYDYFIVGSDQVWNPYFGLDEKFAFLKFTNKNKIAFSASIGVDEIPQEKQDKYRKGLNSLDYISVREERAKEIVQGLTDRQDIEVLLDPTMLLDRKQWQEISKKPKNFNNKKYILTYFLGDLDKAVKEELENYAQNNNLEIIDIMENGKPKTWIGPSEFVYLEENAELICTDSFHSCVFGILMETPFVVFDRIDKNKNMNSRIETLLCKFEMQDRKYNGSLTEKVFLYDFSHCQEILKKERKKAEEFLKKAFDQKS